MEDNVENEEKEWDTIGHSNDVIMSQWVTMSQWIIMM